MHRRLVLLFAILLFVIPSFAIQYSDTRDGILRELCLESSAIRVFLPPDRRPSTGESLHPGRVPWPPLFSGLRPWIVSGPPARRPPTTRTRTRLAVTARAAGKLTHTRVRARGTTLRTPTVRASCVRCASWPPISGNGKEGRWVLPLLVGRQARQGRQAVGRTAAAGAGAAPKCNRFPIQEIRFLRIANTQLALLRVAHR